MNLHEAPEFRDALIAAARVRGVSEQFVEKDYYVTEALRVVQRELPTQAVFKGGTSLSKGWALIERFSEDIDLFVDPTSWDPPLSKRGVDRALRELRDAVGRHPALSYVEGEGRTLGGLGREDYFEYESEFAALPGVRAAVLLEPGVQSGSHPTEEVTISSLVGEFLRERGEGTMADDLEPFRMRLLHFRRTFVEKLFTVHAKIERLKLEDVPLGRNARHYADIHALAAQPEVERMLRSPEYEAIKADYDETSRRYFPDSYRPPDGMSFAQSDALFPPTPLRAAIVPEYERECELLFPGPYPRFDEVLGRLETLRGLL